MVGFLTTTVTWSLHFASQPDGQFIVAGLTWDDQFPTRSLSGLYSEPDIMGVGDGFIMAFTADHWLSWSTYFGGGEASANAHADCIRTIALKGRERLYAAGYTDAAYDQGEFFPMHDEGNGAWPDQTYDPQTDGFVSAFCIGAVLTTVHEAMVDDAEPLALAQISQGQWQVIGLEPGTHQFTLFDAAGRVVQQGHMQGGSAAILRSQELGRGMYAAQFDAERAVRLIVTQ